MEIVGGALYEKKRTRVRKLCRDRAAGNANFPPKKQRESSGNDAKVVGTHREWNRVSCAPDSGILSLS